MLLAGHRYMVFGRAQPSCICEHQAVLILGTEGVGALPSLKDG